MLGISWNETKPTTNVVLKIYSLVNIWRFLSFFQVLNLYLQNSCSHNLIQGFIQFWTVLLHVLTQSSLCKFIRFKKMIKKLLTIQLLVRPIYPSQLKDLFSGLPIIKMENFPINRFDLWGNNPFLLWAPPISPVKCLTKNLTKNICVVGRFGIFRIIPGS